VLKTAFELQSNALDSCAAACTCKGWQAAVTDSPISTLHLHANGISNNKAFTACLATWCEAGQLKLTAPII